MTTEREDRPRALPRRATRRGWWVVVVGVLALGLAVVVGPNVWVALAGDGRTVTVEEAPERSVAIVLGAGLDASGEPTPFLAARLETARALYEDGTVDAILVSGDNRTSSYDEPSAMRETLVEAGVPAGRVVADFAGRDTYDTCVRAREVFEVPDAIVISQAYHVPRIVAVCNAVGLDTVGVGDESMRRYESAWRSGELREYLANIKAAADVVIRRDPVLGPVEPGITDALERARTEQDPPSPG